MIISKSPRRVLRFAHLLGQRWLPPHASRFSRKDFTAAQLFACLVLTEHQRKSYRGVEALLAGSPSWRDDIGLSRTPDHGSAELAEVNTLCRAFDRLVRPGAGDVDARPNGPPRRPAPGAASPTWQAAGARLDDARETALRAPPTRRRGGRPRQKSPGKWGPRANRERGRTVTRLPKLSLAVDAGSHLILAATASTGAVGDQPFFGDLLYRAWCRWDGVKRVVADGGFDSEDNLRLAELDLNVRATIPPRAGRPTSKAPSTPMRADMARRMEAEATRTLYGQR